MMRRRPVESSSTEKTDRRERRRKIRNKKASSQSTRLCLAVAVVVIGVPLLWYLYSHYQESRSRDPFTGLKVKPFEQVSDSAGRPRHSLLTQEQDEALETDADGVRYHLVFSTDCTPYQHWQSYLVYYTAMSIQQPGHVTRIASGCEQDEAAQMKEWFDKDVSPLSKRFHLQLTPQFSKVVSKLK